MNTQKTLLAGAIFGGIGVGLGAFGAHALKTLLTETGRMETYELAVRYEFYHALALIAVGIVQQFHSNQTSLRVSSILFTIGILLFSGSLYALCLTQIKAFAWFTPLGGVLLLLGWLFFAVGIVRSKFSNTAS